MYQAKRWAEVVHHLTHRGVKIQIKEPSRDRSWPGNWTYYLYLHLDQFEDEGLRRKLWARTKRYCHDDTAYWETPDFLFELPFHGGVTYYQKYTAAGGARGIEVGCDYGHLWDDGHSFTVEGVATDAKLTVDALHKATTYRVVCGNCGRLVLEAEVKKTGMGCVTCWAAEAAKESEE